MSASRRTCLTSSNTAKKFATVHRTPPSCVSGGADELRLACRDSMTSCGCPLGRCEMDWLPWLPWQVRHVRNSTFRRHQRGVLGSRSEAEPPAGLGWICLGYPTPHGAASPRVASRRQHRSRRPSLRQQRASCAGQGWRLEAISFAGGFAGAFLFGVHRHVFIRQPTVARGPLVSRIVRVRHARRCCSNNGFRASAGVPSAAQPPEAICPLHTLLIVSARGQCAASGNYACFEAAGPARVTRPRTGCGSSAEVDVMGMSWPGCPVRRSCCGCLLQSHHRILSHCPSRDFRTGPAWVNTNQSLSMLSVALQ